MKSSQLASTAPNKLVWRILCALICSQGGHLNYKPDLIHIFVINEIIWIDKQTVQQILHKYYDMREIEQEECQ